MTDASHRVRGAAASRTRAPEREPADLPPAGPGAISSEPIGAVRALRENLRAEERRVSYWRRLVQGRLDLVQARLRGEWPIERALAGARTAGHSRRSPSATEPPPAERPTILDSVARLWETPVPWTDDGALDEMARLFAAVEAELSAYRRTLHQRIDDCTVELVTRYKRDLTQIPTPTPDD